MSYLNDVLFPYIIASEETYSKYLEYSIPDDDRFKTTHFIITQEIFDKVTSYGITKNDSKIIFNDIFNQVVIWLRFVSNSFLKISDNLIVQSLNNDIKVVWKCTSDTTELTYDNIHTLEFSYLDVYNRSRYKHISLYDIFPELKCFDLEKMLSFRIKTSDRDLIRNAVRTLLSDKISSVNDSNKDKMLNSFVGIVKKSHKDFDAKTIKELIVELYLTIQEDIQ